MVSVKKQEALALIYSGKSKTFVRNKFNIKAKRLNKWLWDDMFIALENPGTALEKQVLHMYFFGIPKKKICERMLIKQYQLDNWIKTAFKIGSIEIKSQDYIRKNIARQTGRTDYITQICKKKK